jgi:hypothetical protein
MQNKSPLVPERSGDGEIIPQQFGWIE